MQVSPATDVAGVISRVRQALAPQALATSAGHADVDGSDDALLALLADAATRLQNELTNSGTCGETRLSLPGISVRITTAPPTPFERALNAVFKNRITFV